MQIIGRADTYIINLNTGPSQFIHMPVKPFKFNKEMTIREIAVNNSHTVRGIE